MLTVLSEAWHYSGSRKGGYALKGGKVRKVGATNRRSGNGSATVNSVLWANARRKPEFVSEPLNIVNNPPVSAKEIYVGD